MPKAKKLNLTSKKSPIKNKQTKGFSLL